MNITVFKSKYDKQYYAHVKETFMRSGRTKDEAYNACQEAIEKQAKNMETRKYIWTNSGALFVIYYADGWRYDIVDKDHVTGAEFPYYVDFEYAYNVMLEHINQSFGGIKSKVSPN